MSDKDWVGNSKSAFSTISASNHSESERQKHDYYATEPKATEILLQNENFSPEIWECACGEGHISKVLEAHGYKVISTDLIYRGYGFRRSFDFLKEQISDFDGDIITNPPYKYAKEFAETALSTVKDGHKVAMFLKLTFLESKSRKELFMKSPPKTIYVSSSRLRCMKNGDPKSNDCSSAVAYAWFVWQKGFKGDPIIKWVN